MRGPTKGTDNKKKLDGRVVAITGKAGLPLPFYECDICVMSHFGITFSIHNNKLMLHIQLQEYKCHLVYLVHNDLHENLLWFIKHLTDPPISKNIHTVCFTDLGKLNSPMVV
jgi:hypothetical protein